MATPSKESIEIDVKRLTMPYPLVLCAFVRQKSQVDFCGSGFGRLDICEMYSGCRSIVSLQIEFGGVSMKKDLMHFSDHPRR
jgi:hypothetical protein